MAMFKSLLHIRLCSIRRSCTHVHAVPEDAEPLDPLEEEWNGGDLDQQATEDHHADPDECREDGTDGVLPRGCTEHQRHGTSSHACHHDVQQVEPEVAARKLKTCITAKLIHTTDS